MSELTEIVRAGFDSDRSYLGNLENVLKLCDEHERLEAQNARLVDLEFGFMEQNRALREILHHAYAWMRSDGCDCGTDEPGTCALCEIERVLEVNP